MNKKIVINKLKDRLNLNKDETRKILNETLAVFDEVFQEHDMLRLVGFGTFVKKTRRSRIGRNPQTNEQIQIPEKTVITFKMGESLEKALNPVKRPSKKIRNKDLHGKLLVH